MFLVCTVVGKQSAIISICMHKLFLVVGIIIIIVQCFKRARKEKSSQYTKPDEKGYEHVLMTTKDSDGCKYKKLEDGEGDDSSENTTTDEHKKMLN